ncbi:MAG: hypothetical protein COB23_00145 [Methylophaga sp.]|nr:MAG: hypothetical protein COB23_00145 [Methylophaga sp.]
MKKLLFWGLIFVAAWQWFGPEEIVVLGPGVKVTEIPIQKVDSRAESFRFKDYQITPLASFKIKAKVLSKTNYSLGREADLSPTDLALGWQNMSDESVLENIEISQSGRWYRWNVQEFPIPRKAIETQSANMHMIPANDMVEEMIDRVKQGQIIELSGYLIRVDADDGWRWQSSLTREDTGAHACELVYVDSIQVIN